MTNTNMHLEGFYHHERNEIVQPERYVTSTKYFWEKWVPDIGTNLTVMIMQLRRRAYYNKKTGEKRDCSTLSLETLSKDTGLSKATIKREFNKKISEIFIRRLKNYKYNENLGKKIRTVNTYQVALDDPIHPSDLEQLNLEKAACSDILTDLKLKMSPRSKKSVDNSSPKAQNEPYIYTAQNELANVNTSLNTLNVNVHKKSKINFENFSFTHSLLDKILTATKDEKSIPYFKKIILECSEATINNALEDLQTYKESGRRIKNPGAFFTSRINALKNSFKN